MELSNDFMVYQSIRQTVSQAQQKVYAAINSAMVETYWEIGRQIVQAQGNNERAEYGSGLLKYLSEQLSTEFGKGYTVRNLNNMRAFYIAFPNWNAVRANLSWTHYRLLLKVENNNARQFYLEECVKCVWSTRQLERQINTLFYERLLSSLTADEGLALKLPRFIRFKISGEKKTAAFPPSFPTVLSTARVGLLLSIALFGCKFSMIRNLGC